MSHKLRLITVPIASALALGAAALPATARVDSSAQAAPPTVLPHFFSAGGEDANIAALQRNTPLPTVITVRVTKPNGFDWGDAGIGAGGTVGLLLLGLGGALAVGHRRTTHAKTAGPAPLAS